MTTTVDIDDIEYDDLTIENVEQHHQEQLEGIEFNRKKYEETGEVSPTFFEYVVAVENYGAVHHKALIEKKAALKSLAEASQDFRDISVAYVSALELENASLKEDAKAMADEITELQAQLEEAKSTRA